MRMNQSRNHAPQVEWISCGDHLPDPGAYVWVCLGKTIQVGEARRYQRQTCLGSFNGEQFQLYSCPHPVANMVWAWAPIVMPEVPYMRQKPNNEGDEWKNDDEGGER